MIQFIFKKKHLVVAPFFCQRHIITEWELLSMFEQRKVAEYHSIRNVFCPIEYIPKYPSSNTISKARSLPRVSLEIAFIYFYKNFYGHSTTLHIPVSVFLPLKLNGIEF